ncbi:hypothetical protein FVE85_4865 [Porphyridium purpureum]|uniref:Uncharacterized protein n=1 Tax=Porphyridium purpureum TaxID=35688 RepID=A0A5J4YQX2_PORPP|nr:hypothetical protein FVE85_4865 [Porphyridium purpureum]|eukprot:POR8199..scf236_6
MMPLRETLLRPLGATDVASGYGGFAGSRARSCSVDVQDVLSQHRSGTARLDAPSRAPRFARSPVPQVVRLPRAAMLGMELHPRVAPVEHAQLVIARLEGVRAAPGRWDGYRRQEHSDRVALSLRTRPVLDQNWNASEQRRREVLLGLPRTLFHTPVVWMSSVEKDVAMVAILYDVVEAESGHAGVSNDAESSESPAEPPRCPFIAVLRVDIDAVANDVESAVQIVSNVAVPGEVNLSELTLFSELVAYVPSQDAMDIDTATSESRPRERLQFVLADRDGECECLSLGPADGNQGPVRARVVCQAFRGRLRDKKRPAEEQNLESRARPSLLSSFFFRRKEKAAGRTRTDRRAEAGTAVASVSGYDSIEPVLDTDESAGPSSAGCDVLGAVLLNFHSCLFLWRNGTISCHNLRSSADDGIADAESSFSDESLESEAPAATTAAAYTGMQIDFKQMDPSFSAHHAPEFIRLECLPVTRGSDAGDGPGRDVVVINVQRGKSMGVSSQPRSLCVSVLNVRPRISGRVTSFEVVLVRSFTYAQLRQPLASACVLDDTQGIVVALSDGTILSFGVDGGTSGEEGSISDTARPAVPLRAWTRVDEYRDLSTESVWSAIDHSIDEVCRLLGVTALNAIVGISSSEPHPGNLEHDHKQIGVRNTMALKLLVPGRYSYAVVAKALRVRPDRLEEWQRFFALHVSSCPLLPYSLLLPAADEALKTLMDAGVSAEDAAQRILKRADKLSIEMDAAMLDVLSFPMYCGASEPASPNGNELRSVPIIVHRDGAMGVLREMAAEETEAFASSDFSLMAHSDTYSSGNAIFGRLAMHLASNAGLQVAACRLHFHRRQTTSAVQATTIESFLSFNMSLFLSSLPSEALLTAQWRSEFLAFSSAPFPAASESALSRATVNLSLEQQQHQRATMLASWNAPELPCVRDVAVEASRLILLEGAGGGAMNSSGAHAWSLIDAARDVFELLLDPTQPAIFGFLLAHGEYSALAALGSMSVELCPCASQVAAALSGVHMFRLRVEGTTPKAWQEDEEDRHRVDASGVIQLCTDASLVVSECDVMSDADSAALEAMLSACGSQLEYENDMAQTIAFRTKVLLIRTLEPLKAYGASQACALIATTALHQDHTYVRTDTDVEATAEEDVQVRSLSRRAFETMRNIAFQGFLDMNDLSAALDVLLMPASTSSIAVAETLGARSSEERAQRRSQYDEERAALQDAVIVLVNAVADQSQLSALMKKDLHAPATRMIAWALSKRARLGELELGGFSGKGQSSRDDNRSNNTLNAYEQWIGWEMYRGDAVSAAQAALELADKVLLALESARRSETSGLFATATKANAAFFLITLVDTYVSALTTACSALRFGNEPFVLHPSRRATAASADSGTAHLHQTQEETNMVDEHQDQHREPNVVRFSFDDDDQEQDEVALEASGRDDGQRNAAQQARTNSLGLHRRTQRQRRQSADRTAPVRICLLEDVDRMRIHGKAFATLARRVLLADNRSHSSASALSCSSVLEHLGLLEEERGAVEWAVCALSASSATQEAPDIVAPCAACIRLAIELATRSAVQHHSDRTVRFVVHALALGVCSGSGVQRASVTCEACRTGNNSTVFSVSYASLSTTACDSGTLLSKLEEWRRDAAAMLPASRSYYAEALEFLVAALPKDKLSRIPFWLIQRAAWGSASGGEQSSRKRADDVAAKSDFFGSDGELNRVLRVLVGAGRADLAVPLVFELLARAELAIRTAKDGESTDVPARDVVCLPHLAIESLVDALRNPSDHSHRDAHSARESAIAIADRMQQLFASSADS